MKLHLPEGDGGLGPKADQASPSIASDQAPNLAADQAMPPTVADQTAGPQVEQTPPATPAPHSAEGDQTPVSPKVAIAAQRVAVVERLRESTAIPLAKGDNSLDLARARSMQTWLARREIDELVPKILKKYNNELKSKKQASDLKLIVPGRIFSLLEWSDSVEHERHALEIAQKLIEQNERNEFEALEAAALDLVRLERYEQRCWSRQKRAIRAFMNLRMIAEMN